MSDQGIWWKLWASALSDPDLDNLDVADFGRYCKLGALVKHQGTAGQLHITAPARLICTVFQVSDYAALRTCFMRLPHVTLCNGQGETDLTVTFSNWAKYQTDYSTPRVKRFREMKRSRREEKRRDLEEKRNTPPSPLKGDARVILEFLNEKTGKSFRTTSTNLDFIAARLRSGASVQDCKSLIARKVREWSPDPKMAMYLRPATLFNATKFEQYLGEMNGHD